MNTRVESKKTILFATLSQIFGNKMNLARIKFFGLFIRLFFDVLQIILLSKSTFVEIFLQRKGLYCGFCCSSGIPICRGVLISFSQTLYYCSKLPWYIEHHYHQNYDNNQVYSCKYRIIIRSQLIDSPSDHYPEIWKEKSNDDNDVIIRIDI